MRLCTVGVLFALSAGVVPAQDAFVVLVQFDKKPAPGIVDAVHEELDELFGAAGLEVDLRQIVARPLRRRHERAAVVHFSHSCQAPNLINKPDRTIRTLAHVHEAGNRILDLIEVDCAAVSHYISTEITSFDLDRLDVLYSRALARVVAHELLHWLMNERKHTKSRLFRSHVEARHLIADDIELEREELGRLRHRTLLAIAGGL